MTNISTERVYYADTYLDKLEATILEIGQDENGSYVIFDKTIFHPQGGGQPVDEGYLEKDNKCYSITKLVAPRNPYEEPYTIKHYYKGEGGFLKGVKVIQVVDMEKRLLYARYHSAGHLLSMVVNQLYPKLDGYKGNHFPGQAFVIFEGNFVGDFQSLKDKLSNFVNEAIKSNLSVLIEWKDEVRTIRFNSFSKVYPCGGTHVKNTSEIGKIIIRNIKKDKGNLRIDYNVK